MLIVGLDQNYEGWGDFYDFIKSLGTVKKDFLHPPYTPIRLCYTV
jgi:hypothetical protein